MPRKVVLLVTGEIYHIYNRGVDKRNIFENENDYLRFYQSLIFFNRTEPVVCFRDAAEGYRVGDNTEPLVEVIAYSLLANHYHRLLKQVSDNGVSEYMKRTGVGYTGYFNDKYKRSGSLFQGTFKRVLVETDEQYNYLFAYVNENSYVHNYCGERELYQSSSLHYQKIAVSKLIGNYESIGNYNFSENVKLAKEICRRRKSVPDLGFLD